LNPHSPGADQIETLQVIGFVAAAIVIVAVNGALIYALRRRRTNDDATAGAAKGSRRTQFRVGAALTIFAAAVLVLSVIFTDKARQTPVTGDAGLTSARSTPLKIEATGQQWLWRYDYPNQAFSYYKLVVPVDTTVELDLVSTDVIHTWDVPQLAPQRDAVPGKTSHAVFRADEEGVYRGQSSTFSGQAYAAMRTEVDVVSADEYEAFIARQKADIQAAQDRVVGLIEKGEVP
jgi:cytochrome c oxidase subunit II